MIGAGAQIDRQDAAGDTALIVAVRGGHAEACRALLRTGADARLRNHDRLSALDVARRSGFTAVASMPK